mmetsp:Transcript_17492/g.53542  ORF Transcript_17492/g.53542 Transcript_17492/m.53542 type:complete len:348 (-) Transcript_17492:47-1090(-)
MTRLLVLVLLAASAAGAGEELIAELDERVAVALRPAGANPNPKAYGRAELRRINERADRVADACDAVSAANTPRGGTAAWAPGEGLLAENAEGKPLRVAVCFFGVTRSLTSTICNLRARVFRPLELAGAVLETFVHTYSVDRLADNQRNNEFNHTLRVGEWRLLPHLHAAVETSQEDFLRGTDIDVSYAPPTDVPEKKYAWGDKSAGTLRNLICQYKSLEEATLLWTARHTKAPFDVVVYLRPDVAYLDTLDPAMLRRLLDLHEELRRQVWVSPAWQTNSGRNDRMAFGTPGAMKAYGTRLRRAARYVEATAAPLHAEKFLEYDMRKLHNREAGGPAEGRGEPSPEP